MSKRNLIVSGLVAVLVAASLFLGYRWGAKSVEPEIVTRTEYKTIKVKDPVPSYTVNTGRLIFVPVKADENKSDSTVRFVPSGAPTSSPDSLNAEGIVKLPEQLREYEAIARIDNDVYINYKIGVTGYNPSLSYADFSIPYTHSTSVVERKQPFVEVAVGPMAGFGYGVIGRNMDFFVGAGVALKFNLKNR